MDALDHLAVDESAGRRSLDVELDAALALNNADIKRFVAFQKFLAVIQAATAIENSK
jgi:hypothetical protein